MDQGFGEGKWNENGKVWWSNRLIPDPLVFPSLNPWFKHSPEERSSDLEGPKGTGFIEASFIILHVCCTGDQNLVSHVRLCYATIASNHKHVVCQSFDNFIIRFLSSNIANILILRSFLNLPDICSNQFFLLLDAGSLWIEYLRSIQYRST